ncbi:MAG: hypothetical protein C0621_01215 [Desulfuromonas sp.]|nr:MAG: hypothetical protein C0621_01215 [Desulfuromonas sp.]
MPHPSLDNTPPLVLIVDDELFMRELLGETLREGGFRTKTVASGKEALAFVAETTPDLILLDLIMPEMDGFATCAALRQLPQSRHTPIMAVTGADDTISIHHAFDVGVTDFVTKQIKGELLVYRILYMLRSSSTLQELIRSEERLTIYREAMECLPIGVTMTDAEGRITYMNPAEAEMHGFNRDELLHRSAGSLGPGRLRKKILPSEMEELGVWSRESTNLRKNGDEFPVQLSSICVRNGQGDALGMVTVCEDITERKEAEKQIEHLAFYDTLTGLPNRWMFQDRLNQAIALAERDQSRFALFFLDLDRFKDINDTLGHQHGDKLLEAVAQRLQETMRKADTFARLGGDEFTLILTGLEGHTGAAMAARRLLELFDAPFIIEGRPVRSSASVGVAIYPDDGTCVDDLLRNADTAMYHAKGHGGRSYRFFSREMHEEIVEKISLEGELRRALEKEEFELYYQPQFDLANGQLVGCEALVRWQHPERGLIMPGEFIPLLEETGLILPLGDWVLKTACQQAKEWLDAGFASCRMAVNISSAQFRKAGFLDELDAVLSVTGLPPSLLELELTESLVMERSDKSRELLAGIRERGIQLSIDDFGTGYSSLSYLKNFPIQRIKIDRSFITDVVHSQDDAAIVEAIILMARSLGLKVIAEGVETVDQIDFLRHRQCEEVQGYYFSKPLQADALFRLVLPSGRLAAVQNIAISS